MRNKKRNIWLSAAIMCAFLIISFQFDKDGIRWFWTGQEIVPIVLGLSSLIFGIFWFLEYKNKTKNVEG